MSSLSRQEEEVSSLESIYNQDEFSMCRQTELGAAIRGKLCVIVELPTGITLVDTLRSVEDMSTLPKVYFLPPLAIHFSLPKDYPTNPQSAPKFTVNCHWIDRNQLSKICRHLDSLWDDAVADLGLGFDGEQQGTEILFTWANFLKDELFSFLELSNGELDVSAIQNTYDYAFPEASCSNTAEFSPPAESEGVTDEIDEGDQFDARAVLEMSSMPSLAAFLTEYNSVHMKAEFDRKIQLCDICFDEKLGSMCVAFIPCRHVFCKECTSTYFDMFIGGGRAVSITCPGTNCLSAADFHVIKELAAPELFEKYDRMLIEGVLLEMGDMVYCPRKECQFTVFKEGNKLGRCGKCGYAFCVECRKGYHYINPCQFKSGEEVRLTVEYASGNAAQREALEKRHGRRRLQQLLDTAQTKDWIADNSKDCPQCNAAIQKSFGCNKMSCWRCGVQFCWMCGQKVDQDFPYLHYLEKTSPCFQLLFRGQDIQEEGINDAIFEEFAAENHLAAIDFDV